MSGERGKRPQQISAAISQFLEQSGLRERVEQDLKTISKDALLVASFFRAESVAYVSD